MFLQLSTQAKDLLLKRIEKEDTRPLVLVGTYGSGRFHHIQSYIREKECGREYSPLSSNELIYKGKCGCQYCLKIVKQRSPDLVILNGRESIDVAREAIAKFKDSQAAELTKKYLILRNIEYYSRDILDAMLKLIEEPAEQYEVLATLESMESCPPALSSRMIACQLPEWETSQLADLCENFDLYAPFKNITEKSNASSPYELTSFLSVTQPCYQMFEDSSNMEILTANLKKIWQRINDSEAPNMALLNFLKYLILETSKNPSKALQAFLPSLCESYRGTLFNNAHKINSSFSVNMENQLYGFLATILALRKR